MLTRVVSHGAVETTSPCGVSIRPSFDCRRCGEVSVARTAARWCTSRANLCTCETPTRPRVPSTACLPERGIRCTRRRGEQLSELGQFARRQLPSGRVWSGARPICTAICRRRGRARPSLCARRVHNHPAPSGTLSFKGCILHSCSQLQTCLADR